MDTEKNGMEQRFICDEMLTRLARKVAKLIPIACIKG